MRKFILAISITLIVIGLASLVINTNTNVELHQLDVKTKQAEINHLEKQIDKLEQDDENDSKRLKKLKQENDRLQRELSLKRAREAEAAKNAVYAAAQPTPPPAVVNKSSNVQLAQSMAANKGWTGSQWNCLYSLWQKESGFNHLVWNTAGSGAYGIPQSLPASKMASHGADYLTNPATQIAWGLDYIAGRYGTPCGAWNHSVINNWY